MYVYIYIYIYIHTHIHIRTCLYVYTYYPGEFHPSTIRICSDQTPELPVYITM